VLENANDLKPYSLLKILAPGEPTETNITKSFKPKNYTVPMDYDGDRLVYVYKKIKRQTPEPGPEFTLNVLDLTSLTSTEVPGFTTSLRMLRFFRDGFVYVKDNKLVHYYCLKTSIDYFLYNHQLTIVNLAVWGTHLATIDKGHCINIMDHETSSFVCNDLHLHDFQNIPGELAATKLFEMEYPYFSALNDSFYAFTSDFGVVMVNYRS